MEVEARAPEFGVGALDDDAAGGVGGDEGGFDVAEGGDDGLGERGGEAVLGGFAEGDDVDVLGVRGGLGYGEVWEGGFGGGDDFEG